MVERRTCSFCGEDIEPGTGMMYIRKDGGTLNFCSSKCRKNMLELGRTPRFTAWTSYHVKGIKMEEKKVEKGKEGAGGTEEGRPKTEKEVKKAEKVKAEGKGKGESRDKDKQGKEEPEEKEY